jgi:4'-phosphopantetheinyl transferase
VSTPYLRIFEDTLTADERARAERFYFQKHRERFIAGRGLLRHILSRYLGKEPDQLRFCYNSYGKPALTEETGAEGLCFNLSHSHGIALYALTHGREIGIDIEYFRPDVETEKLAERFFSPREAAVLRALPEHLRKEGFFNCWTRKEAYIKAEGEGMSIPLSAFDVSLTPGEPAALLRTQKHPQETACWSLQALNPAPSYAAALAVKGHDWELKCWQWVPVI